MKYFTIYHTLTGEIRSSGCCLLSDLPLQRYDSSTENLILKPSIFGKQYVKGETVIDLPIQIPPFNLFDYTTGKWLIDADANLNTLRAKRNKLLQNSDWTQLPDAPLATKVAWITYRQQLRDITLQPDPFHIIWPTPPQG